MSTIPDDSDVIGIVISLVLAFAILFIAVALVQGMAAGDTSSERVSEYARLDGPNVWVALHDSGLTGNNETVFNSRGNAIRLTGANDSYYESDSQIEVATDDNWTVATWASVNQSSQTETMTALSVGGRVIINYNGTDDEWAVWYYDDGSRNSWTVNMSAPNQPGNFTHVAASRNGTHLSIYRNGTLGDAVNVSGGSNIESAPVNATNWHGRLEETRTWDVNISATTRSELVNSPIEAQPTGRTARLYFDRGRGTEIVVAVAGGTATLSNGSWVAGFGGQTMDEKTGPLDVTGGNDYRWQNEGPEIKPESGGRLENQPIAWVDYDKFGITKTYVDTVITSFSDIASLPQILMVLVILGVLVRTVRRVR